MSITARTAINAIPQDMVADQKVGAISAAVGAPASDEEP